MNHPDPEIWFDPNQEMKARAVCRACPVQTLCITAAIEFREQYGVWGGTNAYERGTPPTFSG